MKRSLWKFAVAILAPGLAIAAGDATAGKAVYDKACKSCHGADGTPNAAIAKSLKVEMKHLGAPDVQASSDDALKKVLTDGHGKMKPVKSVSGKAADDVVAYMRTLKQ
ncbi:MAG TPA: cytochrome c [Bryobacteraceae bacterium]|nr:cytochrome c [Bryobacteraceae bacterium]